MYEVWVYDEPLGSFVPYRIGGKRLSFDSWQAAEIARIDLRNVHPSIQFKVEYATVRRRRGKR